MIAERTASNAEKERTRRMLTEIRNADDERIRRMLSEIQAVGHADAHVAPDAGNLEIPEDTSTETEAGLESNEEEEKRGGMSRRGGLEEVAGVCGQRGRGIPDMDAVVGICLRGDGRGAQEEEGKGRGKGWRRRGEVHLESLERSVFQVCMSGDIHLRSSPAHEKQTSW
jgi:hypothetical protein